MNETLTNSILLSVVIPVFNSEKTLSKCLDSLLQQDVTDYEIIAVDDGSTDHSLAMLQDYESRYANVKTYHKKNGGQGDARNFGIARSAGQYIAFVDSDDTVNSNYFQKIYAHLMDAPDMLVLAYNRFYDYKPGILERIYPFSKPLPSGDALNMYTTPSILYQIEGSVCIKVIRRELLLSHSSIRFSGIRLAEDLEFSLKLFPLCQKIEFCPTPLYNYRIHKQSSNFDTAYIEGFIYFMDSVCTYFRRHQLFERFKSELEIIFIKQLLISNLRRLLYGGGKHAASFKLLLTKLKSEFPRFRNNNYLKTEPFYIRTAVWFCCRFPSAIQFLLKF